MDVQPLQVQRLTATTLRSERGRVPTIVVPFGPEALALQRRKFRTREVVPAGKPIPDGIEPRMYRSIGREHQKMPGPGESDVVLSGVVEIGDAVGRLEGGPPAVGSELATHRVHVGVVIVQ